MEPAKITDEMAAYFEGVKQTFKAPPGMENCTDLDLIVREPTPGQFVLTTAWELTDEERDKIYHEDAPIFFHIWADHLHPIAATVEEPGNDTQALF